MIHKLVPKPMPKLVVDNELYAEWLSQFDSEKRARMEQCYKDIGLDRLGDYSGKQIFTKIEALMKDPETVAPRVIFKGTDLYNLISGPIFKELMSRFAAIQDREPLPEVSFRIAYRQHTPDIVAQLERHRCKSFLEADFSANDKTQVKDVIELECMFMARLGAPKWFLKLHRASNKFSVYNSKYGVSAVVENQLPTGATDTTFRNSFWNLTIFYSWCRRMKVKRALACFLGDDMVAGLVKRVSRAARHYTKTAADARMIVKVTTRPHLHQVHFLSKHFVPVRLGENRHVMLPFIGKVLAKFNARPNLNEGVSDDEYMAGKSLSHAYEFRYCHTLRDKFVTRANFHLARSHGYFSMEGVSYHVRFSNGYRNQVEQLLSDPMSFPDYVKVEDLDWFWQSLIGVSADELLPLVDRVLLTADYKILSLEALKNLLDY